LKQVKYLEYIVSSTGISPDPTKIECVANMTPSKNLKKLQSFLDIVRYYRKFIHRFTHIIILLLLLL
jgi:hypothetical protein